MTYRLEQSPHESWKTEKQGKKMHEKEQKLDEVDLRSTLLRVIKFSCLGRCLEKHAVAGDTSVLYATARFILRIRFRGKCSCDAIAASSTSERHM